MTTMNNKFKDEMAFLQSQHAANRTTIEAYHLSLLDNTCKCEISYYRHEIAKYVKLQKHIKAAIKELGEKESLNHLYYMM